MRDPDIGDARAPGRSRVASPASARRRNRAPRRRRSTRRSSARANVSGSRLRRCVERPAAAWPSCMRSRRSPSTQRSIGMEKVGPHRLRAQIAAPDAAGDRVHQEQRHGGEDQKAGEVIDFLRPELDEEEIEAAVRKIDQHRLVRQVRAAVPAHEGQKIIDAERRRPAAPI